MINVTKRNEKLEQFDEEKINLCVVRTCEDLEDVDSKQVVMNAKITLYDGVKTTEIDDALIKSARSLIEREPNYSYVAARLLLGTLYKEVFGESVDSDAFQLQYKKTFIVNIKKLIKAGIVSKEL